MKVLNQDRGLTILEVTIVLALISLMAPLGVQKMVEYLNEKTYQAAATHIGVFNNAAKRYVADNSATLLSGSLPYKLTPAVLINKGYLNAGFSLSTYGQTYVTGIIKNARTSRLEAMTCSLGGITIPEKEMRSVASLIQGQGGFVDSTIKATGAYGGWTDTPANYGLDCAAGHIAIALSSEVLGTDMEENDRLYRYKVNARPELNRMYTSVDMNGNNLNNAGDVNGKSANFENDIKTDDGWLVTKNNKGWLNSTFNGGFTMTDNEWIRAVNNKGITTGGQIKGGTVRAEGRLSTGEVLQLDGINKAGATCAPDGLVSRDSRGAILSCQSGVWANSQDLQQTQCSQTGNWGGRDFTEYRCPVGWYAAGLQFVGHQRNESAYVITCCR